MKKQSITKGFAVLSVAGMLVKVLSLVYMPLLLQILGGDIGYGIYNGAYQIYVFIYVLANAGIPIAISKLISEFIAVGNYYNAIKSFKLARFMLLILGIIMSLSLLLLAYPLTRIMHIEESGLAVFALAPAVLFTSIASAYRGYFQGRGNMTPTAVSQILEQVVNTIFTLFFAALLMKYGVAYACAGGTIGTSLGAFVSAAYLIIMYRKNRVIKVPKGYKEEHTKRYSSKELAKRIIHYGIPITICIGLNYAGNLIDITNTLGRLAAAGIGHAKAIGLYGTLGKYQQLMNVPIALISALAMAVFPSISGAAALNDKKTINEKINYAFRLCFMIAVPSAVGLSVLSNPIYMLIFPRYADGYRLMLIGAVVIILMSVLQIQTSILQGIGRLYMVTFYAMIGIIVKITANYIFIAMPKVNIYGAILGSIIGYLIPVILSHIFIKRKLKVKFGFFGNLVKPLLASIAMAGVLFFTYKGLYYLIGFVSVGKVNNAVSTIVSISLGSIVYFYTMILVRGITKRDLNLMPSMIKKVIPKGVMDRMK